MAVAQKHFHDPFDHYVRKLPEPDREIKGSRVKINPGSVKSVKNLTHDTYELVVKCDEGGKPMGGVAGQYATIKVPGVKKPRILFKVSATGGRFNRIYIRG